MPEGTEDRWLHGRFSDLGFGAGLVYLPVFLLLALGLFPKVPARFLPLVVLAFSTPHIGATLLRAYERDEDRRAYRFFTVYATVAIATAFGVGLYVPLVGSIMITLYFTVVPWHFTGQNFGIALIFLRRGGIEVSPALRRFVYLACSLPFALWILAIHGEQQGLIGYAPLNTIGTAYEFISLQIPGFVQAPLMGIAFGAYLYVLGECGVRLAGRGVFRAAFPALVLLLVQGLWFAAPVLGRFIYDDAQMGPLSGSRAAYTFVWISMTHGIQYLWVTTYYAKRQQPETATSLYLVKALFAGSAIYGLPLLVMTPALLGSLSYTGGLYLMVAGALNLHHVLLDSAIWKLRNSRIASVLFGGDAKVSGVAIMPRRSQWRYLVYASGALAVAISISVPLESMFRLAPAQRARDTAAYGASLERLTWMGRDSAKRRTILGVLLAEEGNAEEALEQFERSVLLRPNVEAWLNIGALREKKGQLAPALAAYQRAAILDPEDATALFYTGHALIRLGDLERGRNLVGRAKGLAPQVVPLSAAESPGS